MAIKQGALVRQIVPAPIQGRVVDMAVDKEAGMVQYLVEWPNEVAGEAPHSVWLLESQITETTEG